jgi:putative hemolysin
MAIPMHYLSKLTAPFVWLLTKTNDLLLRLFGINAQSDGIITEEEIKSMINESTESGEILAIEQDIVERVFALGDLKVGALMTHRSDLVWLDIHDDPARIRATVEREIHGAYPVSDDELDNVIGVVLLKSLFKHLDDPGFQLKEHIITPVYSPETTSAYKLLDDFRKNRIHYSIVLDEFGSVQGMITMDDILDALVGDVSAIDEKEYSIQETAPGTWIADGQYPIHEFMNYFELRKRILKKQTLLPSRALLFLVSMPSPKRGTNSPGKTLILKCNQ